MDWKHKEAFDGAYRDKVSTKLIVSFDTDWRKGVNKNQWEFEKIGKKTVEIKDKLPNKKKIRPNLKAKFKTNGSNGKPVQVQTWENGKNAQYVWKSIG